MDFRSHRLAKGGWTAVNNFRKIHSETAKKSKYASVVKTAEDIEREANQTEQAMDEDSSEEEVQVAESKAKKEYTIDDIMQLDTKLSISKKKKTPVDNKSRGIKKEKKKVQAKKSKKIIKFWWW